MAIPNCHQKTGKLFGLGIQNSLVNGTAALGKLATHQPLTFAA